MAEPSDDPSARTSEVVYISVKKEEAEGVRKILLASGLLRFDAPILAKGPIVSIPLIEGVGEKDVSTTLAGNGMTASYDLILSSVHLKEMTPNSFREIIDIPGDLEPYLPSSWDVVGDLIIVKLQDEILPFKEKLAKALLDTHKSIRSVYRVIKVGGDLRIRELEHIGGILNTETVSREFGVKLHVDPSEVYYSPRLATERWRIVEQVKNGEKILDMFAGIGPFSLVIARNTGASLIHSIDINPRAVHYLKRNIEANRTTNVIPHLGDASEVCHELRKQIKFDRIIMNLPHISVNFLHSALECSKEGTVIHLYVIDSNEKIEGIITNCLKVSEEMGYRLAEEKRIVIKSYSPVEVNICSDLLVVKVPDSTK